MQAYIALKSPIQHILQRSSPFQSLKQEALLFDKIGVLGLQSILDLCSEPTHGKDIATAIGLSPQQVREIQWLIENKVVADVTPINPEGEEPIYSTSYAAFARLLSELAYKTTNALHGDTLSPTEQRELSATVLSIQAQVQRYSAAQLETAATSMGATQTLRAVPLLSYEDYQPAIPRSKHTDVIQIVIRELPLPDNMTPWEQILDFRTDANNKQNLLSLRRWIRRIASEKLTQAELEDELQWLINEFQRYMTVQRMKADIRTIETFIEAPLEIIEDLVRLKISRLPKPFFALKKRQVSLLEAELNAPGREIAYLIRAKEAFGQ